MIRYKLVVEYDGRGYVGWQRQANGPSIQAALEEAVFAFCGERATVHGAGRTDAGVHALGQVAHIEIGKEAPGDTVRDALNFHLRPQPIAVLSAVPAASDFHARFSAIERSYRYDIVNRRAPLALDRGRAWHVSVPLDAAAMGQAAAVLRGRHDFTSFRSSTCQADSPVKTLDQLAVERRIDRVLIHARARSFLHHQVRNIAGTLRLVGEGKWTTEDVAAALAARDRAAGGPTAPAEGLFLTGVGYPDDGDG